LLSTFLPSFSSTLHSSSLPSLPPHFLSFPPFLHTTDYFQGMQRLARSITATKTTQHNSKDLVMREKLPGILHRQMRSCRWSIRNAKITSILCMNM
jgi:hypothetical protein